MKHSKALRRLVCNYLKIAPFDHAFGMNITVFEEEFDYLEHEVFLYLRNHKSAGKEVGHYMFGYSNDELHKLALAYLIKFGLMIEDE